MLNKQRKNFEVWENLVIQNGTVAEMVDFNGTQTDKNEIASHILSDFEY